MDEAELKKMDEQVASLQEKLKEKQERYHNVESGMCCVWGRGLSWSLL